MTQTRLYTVVVATHVIPHVGKDFAGQRVYECDFGGIHFSRQRETDLIKWVRICARNRYGKTTQVIFLHKERTNDHDDNDPSHSSDERRTEESERQSA